MTNSSKKQQQSDLSTVNPDNTVLEYFRPQPPKAYSSTPAVNTNNNNQIGISSGGIAGSSNIPIAIHHQIQSPGQSVILDKSNSPSSNRIVISSPSDASGNVAAASLSLNDSQNYSILGHNSDCASPVSNLTYIIPRCKVILTRTEYFTIPPLDQLEIEDETCVVESFTIGRHGYGAIYWEGPLDIYGLNLDEIVHIRRKEVIVYPDDENKPEEGKFFHLKKKMILNK